MKLVGIRELKAKLSAYIDEVRTGKTILITDHGEEAALVVPLSDDYKLIRFLEQSGKAHWSKGKPAGLHGRILIAGEPLSATILEERK
jgi:prevent-host-death family protein